MKKLIMIMSLLCACATTAFSAPPYDVDVTVTAPSSGGAVDSYELFLDGTSQGTVLVGLNSFPSLITADGTYAFRVDATNSAGTTAGTSVQVTVNALALPGTTTITIQVNCDPCVVTQ